MRQLIIAACLIATTATAQERLPNEQIDASINVLAQKLHDATMQAVRWEARAIVLERALQQIKEKQAAATTEEERPSSASGNSAAASTASNNKGATP